MKNKKSHYKYAVRRLKRCIDIINSDMLLESLLERDKCIFKAVKTLRKKNQSFSSRIDGHTDPENIANHFSQLYMKLYNNITNLNGLGDVSSEIEKKIDKSSLKAINRVDAACVKSAVHQMKASKRDSIFDVTSDMYLHGPDILFDHLSTILKQSLVHGALPNLVLLCTLQPLLRDSLSDITKSDNYQSIAGGCLIIKVLDLVILSLEANKLSTDFLQFAYRSNTGTATCTWTVTAVVDFFTRHGNPVFGAAMDMSKAFDMVSWEELFRILSQRGVEPVFLRLLIYVYTNQQYTVRWGDCLGKYFNVRNGVRQGGVSSGIFFVIYIDEILQLLRESGLGCTIHGVFLGAMIYADDIFLLSASRTGLQQMVNLFINMHQRRILNLGLIQTQNDLRQSALYFRRKREISNMFSQ